MGKLKYAFDYSKIIQFNGENYHIRVRTNSEANPVVLFLHGGPGSPDRAHTMRFQSPLADYLTLVAWDQRGCGKAYDAEKAKNERLTPKFCAKDANNVVEYLKKRFNKKTIFIVGHSYGSQLGLWLASEYPENIAAYIGVGQFVNSVLNEDYSFRFVMEEAIKRNDSRAIKKINEIGPPQNGFYKNNNIMRQRNYLHKYGGAEYGSSKSFINQILRSVPLLLTEYKPVELVKYIRGINYCLSQPIAQERTDFLTSVTTLDVPVYLTLGHHDYNCPWELGEQWFKQLAAPRKELIWFEKSAHSPQWEEPELWNKELLRIVKENDV